MHFGPHKLTFWPLVNPMLTLCFQPMHAARYVPPNILEALKQAHSILLPRCKQVQTPSYAAFALSPRFYRQTNALYEIFTLLPWQTCWNWSQGSWGILGLKPITAEGRHGCQRPAPHKLQRRDLQYPSTALQDEALMISCHQTHIYKYYTKITGLNPKWIF